MPSTAECRMQGRTSLLALTGEEAKSGAGESHCSGGPTGLMGKRSDHSGKLGSFNVVMVGHLDEDIFHTKLNQDRSIQGM